MPPLRTSCRVDSYRSGSSRVDSYRPGSSSRFKPYARPSTPSAQGSYHRTQYSRGPPKSSQVDKEDYLEDLREREQGYRPASQRLHSAVTDPHVQADRFNRRTYHFGRDVAKQFDLDLPHVLEAARHMLKRYDTVSCYSMGLLEEGHIVYFLDPFVLGFDQDVKGGAATSLGGSRFEAAVQLKGRFGIVTRKIGHNVKVAQMYTFRGRGLESKPPAVHKEYVELRDKMQPNDRSVSPHVPLEIEKAVGKMKPSSFVHLVTDKITLSSQILIAGSISAESLNKLNELIRQIEG